MAIVVSSLVVVALLAFTPRADRGLAFGSLLAAGGVVWLAVRIKLHSVVGSLVGAVLTIAYEYRNDLLLGFAAAIVLIVPVVMIYVAICDQLEKRAAEKSIRSRRSLHGMGLVLRSEHPWLWIGDETQIHDRRSRFWKRN